MVKDQIEARGISDPGVLRAMRTVPRHLFVDEALQGKAYEDYPLPIGHGQTISQPYIVALMSSLLEVKPGMKVLEIGTGSGYQAAVLSEMGADVYTVERIRSLYQKARTLFSQLKYHYIKTKLDDGTMGWPEKAPFDGILVTAGGPDIPEPLLDQLAEPQELRLSHPLSGQLTDFTLTRDMLTQFIFNAMYSSDFVALLPLLIYQAQETGDLGPLVSQALAIGEQAGITPGLLYAVTCAEDAPFISLEEAATLQSETVFPLTAETFLQICEGWPAGTPFAGLRQPLVSDRPVLLLSGEADPVTPPYYAEQVAANLPNGRHLTIPGYAHGVAGLHCVNEMMSQFVGAASVDNLNVDCLDKVTPPPFFVTLAGPKP